MRYTNRFLGFNGLTLQVEDLGEYDYTPSLLIHQRKELSFVMSETAWRLATDGKTLKVNNRAQNERPYRVTREGDTYTVEPYPVVRSL